MSVPMLGRLAADMTRRVGDASNGTYFRTFNARAPQTGRRQLPPLRSCRSLSVFVNCNTAAITAAGISVLVVSRSSLAILYIYLLYCNKIWHKISISLERNPATGDKTVYWGLMASAITMRPPMANPPCTTLTTFLSLWWYLSNSSHKPSYQ